MHKKYFRSITFSLLFTMSGVIATASSITFTSGDSPVMTITVGSFGAGATNASIVHSTVGALSISGPPNTASASADLTTGMLHASASGTAIPSADLFAYGFAAFDNFGTQPSALIGYSSGVDGSLYNSDPNGSSSAASVAVIWDVTGVTNPLQENNGILTQASGLTFMSGLFVFADVYGAIYGNSPACPSQSGDLHFCSANSTGTPLAVSAQQSGTFTALPGHVYMVGLRLLVNGQNPTLANHGTFQGGDFSNTSVFRFTDLGGTTLVSSAGEFQSADTPEPATVVLLSAGLLALAVLKRRVVTRGR